MAEELLRTAFLTSSLTDEQLTELVGVSEQHRFEAGEILFTEGDPATFLWILLEGAIEMSRQTATDRTVFGTMRNPGQWAGGLTAWDAEHAAGYRATGQAVEAGSCLKVPSDELGRLVGDWFPFGKHLILGIYQTLRTIEASARQRESMVALGKLAAGLAHEINNPAAAAVRSVEALQLRCTAMFSSLTKLAQSGMTPAECAALDLCRVEAAGCVPPASAMARADLEDELTDWLEDRHLDADDLAPTLAAAGVDCSWCDRVAGEIRPEVLAPGLGWIAGTLDANALLSEVHDSTTRISELVDAVKSYSQLDRASRQRVKVSDGIESTLVMLGHKMSDVNVTREYGDVPVIEVFAAELNQVWTNLIDNAIEAMDGEGSLVVRTRMDGHDLVVEIADTGHGMLPEVQARAFEPFFTTKDVGQGTGLGLDISRRIIVDRHGGDITFDSSPAGTTARVRLPTLHPAASSL